MRITPVKRWVITGLAVCAWGAALAWWAPWHEPERDLRDNAQAAGDTLNTLEIRQATLAEQVDRYRPGSPVQLDSIATPLADTLPSPSWCRERSHAPFAN